MPVDGGPEQVGSAFNVSRETLRRLVAYVDLVTAWGAHINLVSRRDFPHLWSRHVADALQLIPVFPPSVRDAIDLGSGAGFPAIPVAIATGCHFHLVESDQRKATFLREAARITAAPVTVHAQRAEQVALPLVPLVTARAFAPLATLITQASRFLAPDGVCVLPKGVKVDVELTEARLQWQMHVERFPSRIDPTGTILRISGISRVRPQTEDDRDRQSEGRRRQDDHCD